MKKVALITGASSGIGRCLSISLASNGFYSIMASRDLSKLKAVKSIIDANNEGICSNSNWDVNMNSTLETDIYQLNTFDENTFQLHNLGGMVNNFPNYWEGLVDNAWYDYFDTNDNGIADLDEINCSNELVTVCPYQKRVQGAPYFLGFNTQFSSVPEFMPLDTALYTVWVPELADTGRIYTPLEALNIKEAIEQTPIEKSAKKQDPRPGSGE